MTRAKRPEAQCTAMRTSYRYREAPERCSYRAIDVIDGRPVCGVHRCKRPGAQQKQTSEAYAPDRATTDYNLPPAEAPTEPALTSIRQSLSVPDHRLDAAEQGIPSKEDCREGPSVEALGQPQPEDTRAVTAGRDRHLTRGRCGICGEDLTSRRAPNDGGKRDG